jgi:beta-lactamase class A
MKVQIEKIAEDLEGTMGVAVKNLGTGEEVTLNGDELFQLASVFKVPVIVTLYREVDAGNIRLDDKVEMTHYSKVPGSGVLRELTPGLELTIRDYRALMMLISDNTATDTVVEAVGKDNVNKTMLELGLKDTKISTCREILFGYLGLDDVDPEKWTIDLWDDKIKKIREEAYQFPKETKLKNINLTTPRDMMRLLEKIHGGKAASRCSCDEILALMKRCQTGGNRIWRYLPRDRVDVAHKTGTVNGVVNDAGIVFPKDGDPYIICVFTKDIEAESGGYVSIGEEAIAKVSKIAYDRYSK